MPSFSSTVSDLPSCGLRLDRYIAENLGLLSRSQIKARQLVAKVNGREAKISRPVKNGDTVELLWNEAEPVNLIPEDIPLDIIFENERVVVLNKPQGMVVHPGAGNCRGTLANALFFRMLNHNEEFKPCGLRPGIVHRLDKETSGVMVAAYDDEAHAFLAGQFKSRKAKKTYLAIVRGIPKEHKGQIETFIARDPKNRKRFVVSGQGRHAITHYSLVKSWESYSLLLLRPKTGRTHQLRVHLRHIGHPIVGDPLYGHADTCIPRDRPEARLMLHSRSLAITLPGETQPQVFKAPLPQRFKDMIHRLNGEQ
jgi:23S rRNA pseudouridine1911/1915/1917 synthase